MGVRNIVQVAMRNVGFTAGTSYTGRSDDTVSICHRCVAVQGRK